MRSLEATEKTRSQIVRLWREDGLTVVRIQERYRGRISRERISKIIKEATGLQSLRPSTYLPAGGEP